MEYFELFQSGAVENPVRITGVDFEPYRRACAVQNNPAGGDFDVLDDMKAAFFSGQESEEICDILEDPVFLISENLKAVFEMYDKDIRFKAIQLLPVAEESGLYPLYWVPRIAAADCLHRESAIQDNGMVSRLVLDGAKMMGSHIFCVGGILEYKVVISLPVAESILRRRMYGIGIRRAEVK